MILNTYVIIYCAAFYFLSVSFYGTSISYSCGVFRDDIVSNQSDMCFSENKMENGTRETEKVGHMKMVELSGHYLSKEHFEMKMPKNENTSRHYLEEELTDIATRIRNYLDEAKNESIKQNETVKENIDRFQEIFTTEIEKVRTDIIKL